MAGRDAERADPAHEAVMTVGAVYDRAYFLALIERPY
jgi:hypothetical protein